MKYRVIYNKGLPKSMLQKIKNREYTLDEIHSMYQILKRNHDAKQKGWIRAMIILIICQQQTFMVYLFSIGFVAVLCILILVYAKINAVNKEIKQFQKALEIGYPELAERFFMKSS
mgnify:CR=1 FL=1